MCSCLKHHVHSIVASLDLILVEALQDFSLSVFEIFKSHSIFDCGKKRQKSANAFMCWCA